MKKIKVLHMPLTNSGSGVSQYVLQNWKFIDKDRFQFDFATRSNTLDFANELTEQGCKIHYLSCSSEENEEQFIREMNQIFDDGYDVVHLHTSYWKGYLVEKLAIERNVPKIIIHSHSTMVDILDEERRNESIRNHNFYRNSLPLEYATDFCACSKQAAEWLFGEQVPRERIHILKNAINVPKFSFSPEIRNVYRNKLGLEGCFVLGHVGRFVYQKNHGMLIEIFRIVHQKIPHARLLLVGDGILETKIRQKVKEYELEEKVVFLGRRSDVAELLQAMDIFLLPSHFEGLPIVLVEAQAAGLKCLANSTISQEVKVTPNLEFAAGNITDWVKYITKVAKGYARLKIDHLIKREGYDLRHQIKVIEKLYAGEDISDYCQNAVEI